MPPRRTILKKLKIFRDEYPNSWLANGDIRGFRSNTPAHAEAINRLLEEKLILAIRGEPSRESEAAYRLNPDKLSEVNTELFRHWQNWLALAVALLVAGIAAFLVTRAD